MKEKIKMKESEKKLSSNQTEELFKLLKARFEANMHRHIDFVWENIQEKLINNPDKLWSLYQMEQTGGEPDVIGYDKETDQYTFFDCSAESPIGRRNTCYDRAALESRKENRPGNNALDMASEIGIELLDEEQYRELQKFGKFDLKTSSWIKTPTKIRELGGALFCDRRYDTVFVYHNGAQSYYGVRGFRGLLKV